MFYKRPLRKSSFDARRNKIIQIPYTLTSPMPPTDTELVEVERCHFDKLNNSPLVAELVEAKKNKRVQSKNP